MAVFQDACTVPLQAPHLQAMMPGRDAVVWCQQWLQIPWYVCAVLGVLVRLAPARVCGMLG